MTWAPIRYGHAAVRFHNLRWHCEPIRETISALPNFIAFPSQGAYVSGCVSWLSSVGKHWCYFVFHEGYVFLIHSMWLSYPLRTGRRSTYVAFLFRHSTWSIEIIPASTSAQRRTCGFTSACRPNGHCRRVFGYPCCIVNHKYEEVHRTVNTEEESYTKEPKVIMKATTYNCGINWNLRARRHPLIILHLTAVPRPPNSHPRLNIPTLLLVPSLYRDKYNLK